jgi:nucleoside-diphosphate-sugar epimerase
MKYLLTGCAGFVGARTAELLLDQGHEVAGLDDLNDYYSPLLKRHRLDALQTRPGFRFHAGDVGSRADVDRLFAAERSFDAVINLAARAGVRASMEDPRLYQRTNADGSLNLLEAMRQAGCAKLVLASTSSLYAGRASPFRESDPVDTPISPYAATKRAAEVMAYSYHHLYKIDVSIVRYFTVYGPAGRPDMSPLRFIHWIKQGRPIRLFGDGTQSRDFTYIDDIARGTILALQPVGYEIFNLGGGRRPVTMLEFIRLIEQALGKTAVIDRQPFHQADMLETAAVIDKARDRLGWSPEIDLAEGVQRTVRWYLENESWLAAELA